MRRRTATYPRALRVNQVLRQVLADELERLADADERLRLVTVTAVDMAPDMRTAVVYMATSTRRPPGARGAPGAIAARRGRPDTMKRTPRLTFPADPAIAAGSRVEESAWAQGVRRTTAERCASPAPGEP